MCPDDPTQCAQSGPSDPIVVLQQTLHTFEGAIQVAILFGAVCFVAVVMLGLFLWVMRGD